MSHDDSRREVPAGAGRLRVGLAGASGLVGGALKRRLRAAGHELLQLKRGDAAGPDEMNWQPSRGELEARRLEGLDAMIHLGGVNLGARRWSAARKVAIESSRVDSTRLLAETLARLERPPAVFLCASAVGIYGDRGDAVLSEDSPPGSDWLAGVARCWEEACEPAREAGLRVVKLRSGMVLSSAGGALPRLLPLFRLGLGGPLGSGEAWMSWIALDDLVALMERALIDPSLSGPVNAVAPAPARNRDFARCLGRVLGRPAVLRAPGWLLRLALGEMAAPLLLYSARVLPARLQALGFTWDRPDLETALRRELSGPDRAAGSAAP